MDAKPEPYRVFRRLQSFGARCRRPGPRPTPHERHAAGTMTVRNRSFVHAEGTHCEVPDSFIRSIWSRSSTLLLKRVTAWAIRQKSRKP